MKKKVVVLGAGIAGLAAGYFLARQEAFDVTVLESSDTVGGLCASFPHGEFMLDYGPHKMYSVIPGILDELVALMGERVLRVPKKNKIFLNGAYLEYPLKLTNLLRVLGPQHFVRILCGFTYQKIRNLLVKRDPKSYQDFMIHTFGKPTYELIFKPLAQKVWGEPASLHADMARIRVSELNTFHLILRLLRILPENESTSAKYFYYPRKGFGDFALKLKEEIEKHGGKIVLKASVGHFIKKDHAVTAVTAMVDSKELEFKCEQVISSIPLPQLYKYVDPQAKPIESLQARNLILVYLCINRPQVMDEQWVFFPEEKYVFSRISEQKNMSADIAPPLKTVVCCDFTCEKDSEVWSARDEVLICRCAQQLADAGLIDRESVLKQHSFIIRKPNFYPRYDLDYLQKMSDIGDQLKKTSNVLTTGRLGMFNYNNSDHCFDMGKFIVQGLSEQKSSADIWAALEERVRNYKIVD